MIVTCVGGIPICLMCVQDSSLSKSCLLRQEGIWTFESCYKKGTRQIRKAAPQVQLSGGQATYTIDASPAEEFSCGLYHDDQEENRNIALRSDQALSGSPMTYVSLHYRGGAGCVMTGGNRTSEMRFTCEGALQAKENTLVLVKEFPTCHYIYVVSVPALCAKFPEVFEPKAKTHSIQCFNAEEVKEAKEECPSPDDSSPASEEEP
jgi:protein OS-9